MAIKSLSSLFSNSFQRCRCDATVLFSGTSAPEHSVDKTLTLKNEDCMRVVAPLLGQLGNFKRVTIAGAGAAVYSERKATVKELHCYRKTQEGEEETILKTSNLFPKDAAALVRLAATTSAKSIQIETALPAAAQPSSSWWPW
ncbi:MAG: hypothetical protein MRY21_03020 [Simkaniaceae bacterium]|nr:hypothetical protein [Simkaniaceae bacterium]